MDATVFESTTAGAITVTETVLARSGEPEATVGATEEADTILDRILASEKTSEAIVPVEGAAASMLLRTDSALKISDAIAIGAVPDVGCEDELGWK